MTESKDLKWLEKAEHWGEWKRVPDDKPGVAESVWLLRGGNGNARFYAKGKGQVGPEHKSLVAATYWAWANGWLWAEPDGSIDLLAQLACRQWVLAGGVRQIDVGGSPALTGSREAKVRDAILPSPPETHPSLVVGGAP